MDSISETALMKVVLRYHPNPKGALCSLSCYSGRSSRSIFPPLLSFDQTDYASPLVNLTRVIDEGFLLLENKARMRG